MLVAFDQIPYTSMNAEEPVKGTIVHINPKHVVSVHEMKEDRFGRTISVITLSSGEGDEESTTNDYWNVLGTSDQVAALLNTSEQAHA